MFNALKETYKGAEDDKGSLRMGCWMCPVISEKKIPDEAKATRTILEKLRKSRRINNPRTKNWGAIYIEDRRAIWQELDKKLLVNKGFIGEGEIQEINELILMDSYPKTYTKEWIESEHKRLETATIYDGLPLFSV